MLQNHRQQKFRTILNVIFIFIFVLFSYSHMKQNKKKSVEIRLVRVTNSQKQYCTDVSVATVL